MLSASQDDCKFRFTGPRLFQFLRTSVPLFFSCCIRRVISHTLYYLLYLSRSLHSSLRQLQRQQFIQPWSVQSSKKLRQLNQLKTCAMNRIRQLSSRRETWNTYLMGDPKIFDQTEGGTHYKRPRQLDPRRPCS